MRDNTDYFFFISFSNGNNTTEANTHEISSV